MIHNAESLLKRFILLCTFLKQTIARSGQPRTGYKLPSWAIEWWPAQPFVRRGEVGTRGELPQWVSAATLPPLEHHGPNENLRRGSPGRESGFLSSLKPVGNLGFWEDVWELFTNAGGLITQMTDVNKLSFTVVVVIEIPQQAGAQTWWQFQTTERASWLLTDINWHSCIGDRCFIGREGVHSFTAHFSYC